MSFFSRNDECYRCKWWDRIDDKKYSRGYCRRFPPQVVSIKDTTSTHFPITGGSSYCGEFSAK